MASQQQSREELDQRAKQGETVVPGGTGGKSLEAQQHLAEGNPLYLFTHTLLAYTFSIFNYKSTLFLK